MPSVRPDRATLAAFIAMVLLGGANAVGVRFTVAELAPFWAAAIRFGLAGLLLVVFMLATRRPLPRGERLLGTVLYGVLNFSASYALLYWAFRDAPASTGQVLLSVVPLLTSLVAIAHGVERFDGRGLAGAVIAAAGIVVIFGDQVRLDVPIAALLAIVVAAVIIAEGAVVVKRVPPGDPVAANALGMLIGAFVLGTLSLLAGERQAIPTEPATWAALGYLVVFGSIAVFLLVLYVLERWTASATSYSFLLLPLVTVALGALLLREPIAPTFVAGGALVLIGVYVGAIRRPAARTLAASATSRSPEREPQVTSPATAGPPCP